MPSSTPILTLVKGVCGPGMERNPYTQRCNRKCPSSHQRIRNLSTQRFRCYKKCRSGQKRDKHTRRCRGSRSQSRSRSRSRSRSVSRFYHM